VQAVDQYVDNSRTMMRSDTLEALQVVNLTNTGLLMGMVPLFQGMQVRVSANVAKNLLLTRELLGVVVGIKPHRREPKQPMQETTSFEPYIFKLLPSCVLVELDDPILKAKRFSSDLPPGIIALTPQLGSWTWHRLIPSSAHSTGFCKVHLQMNRYQLPLCPRYVNTHFGLQGQTARNGILAFLQKPAETSEGDYFLGVYVMLSRATKLSDILIVDLPERSLFESTDEKGLKNLARLQARIQHFETLSEAGQEESKSIMHKLGWPADLRYDSS
jgi:hypothetical protein